mmetsp:Transcript_54835/g.158647  ORF Transcript_54835/g.158647 Transcript_54835/m.158647 type:complete len:83 (+) Transcript_54835:207-455(+)
MGFHEGFSWSLLEHIVSALHGIKKADVFVTALDLNFHCFPNDFVLIRARNGQTDRPTTALAAFGKGSMGPFIRQDTGSKVAK